VNLVQLHGRIVQISDVRYSPFGLPLIDLLIEHESHLEEAGVQRKIQLRLKALAIGTQAEKILQLDLLNNLHFSGFLASSKNSQSVLFHIQSFHTVS